MTKPTKVAILLVDNEGTDKMKTITITDNNGKTHTATVTVCRPRKARGSNTFSRTAKVRGGGCLRLRNQAKTEIRTRNVTTFGGPVRTEWS